MDWAKFQIYIEIQWQKKLGICFTNPGDLA